MPEHLNIWATRCPDKPLFDSKVPKYISYLLNRNNCFTTFATTTNGIILSNEMHEYHHDRSVRIHYFMLSICQLQNKMFTTSKKAFGRRTCVHDECQNDAKQIFCNEGGIGVKWKLVCPKRVPWLQKEEQNKNGWKRCCKGWVLLISMLPEWTDKDNCDESLTTTNRWKYEEKNIVR